MQNEDMVPEDIVSLSHGPSLSITCYKGYIINGYRFHTKEREERRKTQNSGIVVTAEVSSFASAKDRNPISGQVSYYGVLIDIVELQYLGGNRVILFKCDWWDVINIGRGIKSDEYGFTCLNFDRTICIDEPFVLAGQAKQVFYVQNLNSTNWHTVVQIQPRGVYKMNEDRDVNDEEPYQQLITEQGQRLEHDRVGNDMIDWGRNDIEGETINVDDVVAQQNFINDDEIDA